VTEIIKLLVVIAVIILLIKKKWNLEYVILLASLLAILALIDPDTLKLIGIIVLVYILSGVLRFLSPIHLHH